MTTPSKLQKAAQKAYPIKDPGWDVAQAWLQRAFAEGAAYAREEILGLLRSDKAYNDLMDEHLSVANGDGEAWADWLEAILGEKK